MAKTRKKRARKRYSKEQKAKILETANKEKLTAAAVEKRFGVKSVTYYSWRKGKPTGGRGLGRSRKSGGSLVAQVRAEVQSKVREILPNIVRDEVNRYLSEVLRMN